MTDTAPWLRDTFDRRLAACMDTIAKVRRLANTAFASDLGEGKGSVRARFRRAETLMESAKDDAQRDRYLAQADALRERLLDHDGGKLRAAREGLWRRLDRLDFAYKALPGGDRRAVRKEWPEWIGEPGSWEWFWELDDVDHETFMDLGV